MSITCGFFNSINHDRVYDAVQVSQLFDGLINDGVYDTYGDHMIVHAATGMNLTIGSGRAWFNHTWTLNDSAYPITIPAADILESRIDAVILEVNTSNEVRYNSFKVIEGTPSQSPQKPSMIHTTTLNQYPLAYVSVEAGATSITTADIENAVGTSETPFVNGLIEAIHTDDMIAQWYAQYSNWMANKNSDWSSYMTRVNSEWDAYKDEYEAWVEGFESDADIWFRTRKAEFDTWFANLHYVLDGDVAGHLQNEIDDRYTKAECDNRFNRRGVWTPITIAATGWDQNTAEYSLEDVYPSSSYDIGDITVNENTTKDMRYQWDIAECSGYYATNKIVARGKVPEIDISLSAFIIYKG